MHTVLIWPLELLFRSLSRHLTVPPHVTFLLSRVTQSLSILSHFSNMTILCFLFPFLLTFAPSSSGLNEHCSLSLSHFLFSHFPLLLLLSFHSSSQLPCLGSIWQPDPVCGYVCVWSCCGPCALSVFHWILVIPNWTAANGKQVVGFSVDLETDYCRNAVTLFSQDLSCVTWGLRWNNWPHVGELSQSYPISNSKNCRRVGHETDSQKWRCPTDFASDLLKPRELWLYYYCGYNYVSFSIN